MLAKEPDQLFVFGYQFGLHIIVFFLEVAVSLFFTGQPG